MNNDIAETLKDRYYRKLRKAQKELRKGKKKLSLKKKESLKLKIALYKQLYDDSVEHLKRIK